MKQPHRVFRMLLAKNSKRVISPDRTKVDKSDGITAYVVKLLNEVKEYGNDIEDEKEEKGKHIDKREVVRK